MTQPANIRVNIGAPFPSLVKGSGPLTIQKQNGIWSVGFSIANLAQMPANTDPANLEVLLWNTVNKTFQQATLSTLLASAPVIAPTTVNFAMSPYAVQLNDSVLFVDSAGGAVVIDLSLAAVRNGRPIAIKDVTGHAATAGHNISIIPSGAETIEGLNPLVINANYGGFRLYPATAKYVIAP